MSGTPRKGLKREGMRSYRITGPEGDLLIDRAPEMRRFFVRNPEWPNGFFSLCARRLTEARDYAETATGLKRPAKTEKPKGRKHMTTIHPVDAHVGNAIRARRKVLGITALALGNQIGVTFQQITKYEHGTNRVSASRLYEIAKALNTTASSFFEGFLENAA